MSYQLKHRSRTTVTKLANIQMESCCKSGSSPTIKQLVDRMTLFPLIESCETVWPSSLDIQLILPTYEADLRNLRCTLEKNPSQLIHNTDEEDILNLQASFISCCYESTAFILSEELAAVQQTLREDYIWSKLMRFSTGKVMVSTLFKQWRKTLLAEDWFYQFGNLSSFWGFVWDLLDFDRGLSLIDRNDVNLIEQICFRLMQTTSVQLFVKGVTVLEECIYKTRGHSLMDYEAIYSKLSKYIWRLSSDDERYQNASIVLLSAMFECVRVLEVERNQLMTLIENFAQPSRADSLMDILLKGLAGSHLMKKSRELMEMLLQLLAIDHKGIRVVPVEVGGDLNNNGSTDSNGDVSLVIMRDLEKIDLGVAYWWKELMDHNKGRFHRWTRKLLRLLISEVEKFENFDAVHFQYLSCAMFFIVRLKSKGSVEQVTNIFQLMVTFVKKMVIRLQPMIDGNESTRSTIATCKLLIQANVALVKECEKLVLEAKSNNSVHQGVESRQSQYLNSLLLKIVRW